MKVSAFGQWSGPKTVAGFIRRAWTGGSWPTPEQKSEYVFKCIRSVYFREQVAECGGLDLWACAGTSARERARIFWNRATADAHATLHQ